MEWFRKHTDACVILASFAACMLWMNGKFNDLEKDIVMIKTVLIMRNVMPSELASHQKEDKF